MYPKKNLRFVKEIFFPFYDLAVTDIDPRHAAVDITHDFIIDGPGLVGQFFNGNELIALTAK